MSQENSSYRKTNALDDPKQLKSLDELSVKQLWH